MMSSYRQLLVHIDDTPRAAMRLSLARRLAAAHGASTAALYAVRPAYEMALAAPDVPAILIEQLSALDEERLASARRRFDAVLAEPGPQVTWGRVKDVDIIGAFTQQSLYTDLLVLGQHDGSDDPQALGSPPDFLSSVVTGSGKPALVVPFAGEPGNLSKVAIAWKPTREAARAVSGAMPLLQRADSVVVLAWGEEDQSADTSLDLKHYLRTHGVEADVQHQGPDETAHVGELLLSRACDLSVDLLVMGCYGHSRGREWLLGGVTRTVLESMTVPVLMAH